jgi:hypothetical protein
MRSAKNESDGEENTWNDRIVDDLLKALHIVIISHPSYMLVISNKVDKMLKNGKTISTVSKMGYSNRIECLLNGQYVSQMRILGY